MRYLPEVLLVVIGLSLGANSSADQYILPYGWSGGNGVLGQCLLSNGPLLPPSFQACGGGSSGAVDLNSAQTLTNKTLDGSLNTFLNLPAGQLVGSLDLTNLSGQWTVANGGTGASTLTGILKGNGTSPFTTATATDISGLYSGAHNSPSYYLASDGSQQLMTSGGGNDVQVFTTTGTATWTKPSGSPKFVRVLLGGGGGGGGGGNHVASGTATAGGGGGGSGAWCTATFNASDVGATETVTVGAGGNGGAASGGSGGNNGNAGGTSSFGSWISAFGGGRGAGSVAGANSGGGGTGSCAQVGGDASGSTGGSAAPGATNSSSVGTNGAVGANGSAVTDATGGAGGGGASTTPAVFAGGNSGRNGYAAGVSGGGNTGANGSPGTTPTSWGPGTGGGGGGANSGANGGTGGAGGRSAGGGGGGSQISTGSGGAGGKGGDGMVIVITSY